MARRAPRGPRTRHPVELHHAVRPRGDPGRPRGPPAGAPGPAGRDAGVPDLHPPRLPPRSQRAGRGAGPDRHRHLWLRRPEEHRGRPVGARQRAPREDALADGDAVHLAGGADLRMRRSGRDGRVRARVPRGGRRHADVALLRSDHRAHPRGGEGARGTGLALPDGSHLRRLGARARLSPTRGPGRTDVRNRPQTPGASPGWPQAARVVGRRGQRRMRVGRIGYINCYPVYAGVDRGVTPLAAELVTGTPSSRTAVALLELLCRDVWHIRPHFAHARAEGSDLDGLAHLPHEAVLVIGDAALLLSARRAYAHRYDLGEEWKRWTGLPFVFAVWAARRDADQPAARRVHRALLASRDWGLAHLALLAEAASLATGVDLADCRRYFAGLDYALGDKHLAGLTDFFHRLAARGLVPDGSLQFLHVA